MSPAALAFPAAGAWRSGQVSTTWTTSSRRVIPQVEQEIEATWQAALRRPGIHLFDGPMCRLEHFDANEQRLHLSLSPTSYKAFMGTNLSNAALADSYGRDVLANPVGLSAALISADGFLLLGRRNDRVAYYPSRIHPFAGCLEPAEPMDVFSEIRRELHEELSLHESDIAEMICTGIAEDQALRQPELIFAAKSFRTLTQIHSQLDAAEHVGIFSTPATQQGIEAALESGESFTPVGVAAMLLWGRLEFGEKWFVEHRPHGREG